MEKIIYSILDFETTGLDADKEQITEVGILRTDGEKDYGFLNFYVKLQEGNELTDFLRNFNGITEAELEHGMDMDEAAAMVQAFTKDTVVVCHHAPFDLHFAATNLGLTPEKFICTRVMAKFIEPTLGASLKDVAARLGIPNDKHHRAMNDVMVTKEIFKHYKAIADQDGDDYTNVVVSDKERPLAYFPVGCKLVEK